MTSLAGFYWRQLVDDCLPLWFPRAVDEAHGGFLRCFDHAGSLVDDDKSVWAQGRMSWMLLTLYQELEPRPEWLAWAESALMFLEQKCVDPADGRMFFHVARDGTPLRRRRYAYSESFAAIAHAAHASATGSSSSAGRARHWFDRFTDWNFTPGRIPPKFTGARMMEGIGSRMINPGHSIEAAWFVMEGAGHRKDPELLKLGCDMLNWMWQRGWDEQHGGIFCFRDVHGEWFGYLHGDGTPSNTVKGSLWKLFFHHPLALWRCHGPAREIPA